MQQSESSDLKTAYGVVLYRHQWGWRDRQQQGEKFVRTAVRTQDESGKDKASAGRWCSRDCLAIFCV